MAQRHRRDLVENGDAEILREVSEDEIGDYMVKPPGSTQKLLRETEYEYRPIDDASSIDGARVLLEVIEK